MYCYVLMLYLFNFCDNGVHCMSYRFIHNILVHLHNGIFLSFLTHDSQWSWGQMPYTDNVPLAMRLCIYYIQNF